MKRRKFIETGAILTGVILTGCKRDRITSTLISEIRLSIPFLSQGKDTNNCGQTSVVMAVANLVGIQPTLEMVAKSNRWLAEKYNDPEYLTLESNRTDPERLEALIREYWAQKYKGLSALAIKGASIEMLYKELRSGRPVIISVRSNMNTDKNDNGHFMFLTGISDYLVWVNDPAKIAGQNNSYILEKFVQSWTTKDNKCILIWT